jgi:hypothetical protein
MTVRPDRFSLGAGMAVVFLGVVLLLDQTDAIDISPGWLGAAFAAAAGVILIASGIAESDR